MIQAHVNELDKTVEGIQGDLAALINAAHNGDEDAFEKLWKIKEAIGSI